LSDLAAMGAKPIGLVSAISVPESWRSSLDDLARGIGNAASSVHAKVLGGDLSRGTELSITVTVLGHTDRPLLRSAARAGDTVYVTGRLGGSLAALRDLEAGHKPSDRDRNRFANPQPRIYEARWLAAQGASAAIDISDGLAADAGHIASASRASIAIDLDRVPVFEGIEPADAARSGEEYELIVTAPVALDTDAFQREFKLELTSIGIVGEGPARVTFMQRGEPVSIKPGYLHFSS
jgi:thiamine-monophosphate kinase